MTDIFFSKNNSKVQVEIILCFTYPVVCAGLLCKCTLLLLGAICGLGKVSIFLGNRTHVLTISVIVL